MVNAGLFLNHQLQAHQKQVRQDRQRHLMMPTQPGPSSLFEPAPACEPEMCHPENLRGCTFHTTIHLLSQSTWGNPDVKPAEAGLVRAAAARRARVPPYGENRVGANLP